MTTEPQDPAAAGRARLRAGHADREQVIEALKTAFVDGRLTKKELAARTGRALAARTYADLAALTADLPAERAEPAAPTPVPAVPAPAVPAPAASVPADPTPADLTPADPAPAATTPVEPPRPSAPAIRRPLLKGTAASVGSLVLAFGVLMIGVQLDVPGPGMGPYHGWIVLCNGVILVLILVAIVTFGLGVAAAIEQRSARRQLPPRPDPGGQVLKAGQRDGTSRGSVLPGASPDQTRPDHTRTDARAHRSRRHTPAPGAA